ncbi:hypothetical protein MY4824_007052 [Beauveria thailandica]
MLPDNYFVSFVPIFLVRHPALVVDSWFRASTTACHPPDPCLTARARCTTGVPIVVDADDVLEGDTVPRLTAVIGMDPAQVIRGWEAQSTEGMVPLDKSYMQGICDLTGIDTFKSARRLDIDDMYRSWRETYGEEVAEYIAKVTESYLPDYDYMKSKKI